MWKNTPEERQKRVPLHWSIVPILWAVIKPFQNGHKKISKNQIITTKNTTTRHQYVEVFIKLKRTKLWKTWKNQKTCLWIKDEILEEIFWKSAQIITKCKQQKIYKLPACPALLTDPSFLCQRLISWARARGDSSKWSPPRLRSQFRMSACAQKRVRSSTRGR